MGRAQRIGAGRLLVRRPGMEPVPAGPGRHASTSTDIAAVSRIPGSMEVWWVEPNESVQDACLRRPGTEPVPAGPGSSASTSGGIAAVSRIQNSMEVWWVGPNGSVQDAYYYDASGVALANPAAATGYSPAPAVRRSLTMADLPISTWNKERWGTAG